MGYAEVISLDEVRARKQWDDLRQDLHARFDQWLDDLEAHLPELNVTLAEASDLVWQLRQDLTGGLTETLLTHGSRAERRPLVLSVSGSSPLVLRPHARWKRWWAPCSLNGPISIVAGATRVFTPLTAPWT